MMNMADSIKEIDRVVAEFSDGSWNAERVENLKQGLASDPDLLKEWEYYIEHHTFLGEAKVLEYSFMDVMIWQIDHFRAFLDRDTTMTKRNPDTMVLLTLETLLEMKHDPEKFVRAFSTETGTDRII